MKDRLFARWRAALIALTVCASSMQAPDTPLFSLLAAFAIALFVYVCLERLRRNGGLLTSCRVRFGRAAVCALAALCAGLAIGYGAAVLWDAVRFLRRTAFASLSPVLTGAVLLAVGTLLTRGGIEKIGMWAWPMAFVGLVPLWLGFWGTLPQCDLSLLSSVQSYFSLASFWRCLRYFAPLWLLPALEKERTAYGGLCGALLGGGTLLLALLQVRLLFGAAAQTLPYPVYTASGLLSVGTFFQRGEVLLAACLLPAVPGALALCLLALRQSARLLCPKSMYRLCRFWRRRQSETGRS